MAEVLAMSVHRAVTRIANQAAHRWWLPEWRVMGVVGIKDIVKQGVKEKFADLRKMALSGPS